MIPFSDLRRQHADLLPELLARVESVLRSASFVGGEEVEGFEREFASFCSAGYCAGVGSGTDALRFTFLALGVSQGDEVITVPHTFIATTEAITQAGGRVRFVDIDPTTHTMDPERLEAAITPRTVGVVPVHIYGRPADMDSILSVARKHRLWVVEDAAQAHGARYRGRLVGTLADAACFSFYPGKNLGACGEAGAVVSSDPRLIERIMMLRDHGQERKYVHRIEGYNGRLDAIQAAILRVKLHHLPAWTLARRQVASWYGEFLDGIAGVERPAEPDYAWSVYHLYAVLAEDRDGLRDALSRDGIGVRMHYPVPLHLQEAYVTLACGPGTFPAAELVAAHTLTLPMYPELGRHEVRRVADLVRRFSAAAMVKVSDPKASLPN